MAPWNALNDKALITTKVKWPHPSKNNNQNAADQSVSTTNWVIKEFNKHMQRQQYNLRQWTHFGMEGLEIGSLNNHND